jgi:feruloyl-CoA synthase
MDRGEITDKGSVNQKAVIANRQDLVDKLYSGKIQDSIIEVKTDFAANGANL